MKGLEKKRRVFDSGDEKVELVVLSDGEQVGTVCWWCLRGGGEQSKVASAVMERVMRKLRRWCMVVVSKLVLFVGGACFVVVNNLMSQAW